MDSQTVYCIHFYKIVIWFLKIFKKNIIFNRVHSQRQSVTSAFIFVCVCVYGVSVYVLIMCVNSSSNNVGREAQIREEVYVPVFT